MAYSADSKIKIITNCGVHSANNGREIIFVGQEVSSGKYFFLHAATGADNIVANRKWFYKTKSWAVNYNTGAVDGLRIDSSLDYTNFLDVASPDFVTGQFAEIPTVNVINDTGGTLRTTLNTAQNAVNFSLLGEGITANPFVTIYDPTASGTGSGTGTTASTNVFASLTSQVTDFVSNNPLTSIGIGIALFLGIKWAINEGVFDSILGTKKKRRR